MLANPSSDGARKWVTYGPVDAVELPAALEDARDVLSRGDHLSVLASVEHRVAMLNPRLGFGDHDKPSASATDAR